MGDVAKWVILVAGIILLVGMILAFPVMEYADGTVFAEGVAVILNVASDAFMFARGLINNFLSPFARSAISGLMIWLIGKPVITMGLKILTWVYHYIFK